MGRQFGNISTQVGDSRFLGLQRSRCRLHRRLGLGFLDLVFRNLLGILLFLLRERCDTGLDIRVGGFLFNQCLLVTVDLGCDLRQCGNTLGFRTIQVTERVAVLLQFNGQLSQSLFGQFDLDCVLIVGLAEFLQFAR